MDRTRHWRGTGWVEASGGAVTPGTETFSGSVTSAQLLVRNISHRQPRPPLLVRVVLRDAFVPVAAIDQRTDGYAARKWGACIFQPDVGSK